MHTDPVAHAAEHFAKVDSYQEAMAKEVARLQAEFYQAAMTRTLTDRAGFGQTRVWNGTHGVQVPATVLDVLMDAMDHKSNDSIVFNVLLSCAKKGDADALAAIHQLAYSYADMNAELAE